MRQSRAISSSIVVLLLSLGVPASHVLPMSQKSRADERARHPGAQPSAPSTPSASDTPGVKTDYRVYREPDPPKLPPAGESFIDPVFGTSILRVTDENDGKSNTNAYTYWPSLNRDSTRLFILCDGKPTLYDFDGARLRAFNKRPLFAVKPIVGGAITAEDAIWSAVDPDIVFGHDGMRLWSYSLENKKYTLEKDFVRQLGVGHLHQMSRSADDNVFAFTVRNKNFDKTGYAVWWRDKDVVYKIDASSEMDEVQLDKSGRYLVVKTGKAGRDQVRVQIVDLQTKAIENLIDGEPDYAPGHSDNGSGFIVGYDNWKNRYTVRKLDAPHLVTTVLDFGNDWSLSSGVSMLADDDSWALISTFASNELPGGGLFRNELLLAATDGSKRVRRLAHLHSRYRDYWDTPRANISRDGRFAVFTSNWGVPGRRDVFVLRIPAEAKAVSSK